MEVISRAIRQEKEITDIQMGKEELKLCLFAHDMIFIKKIVNNPPQKKQSGLINEFSKVVGYKINMQKSAVLLYTSNEQSKKDNKKVPFTTTPK